MLKIDRNEGRTTADTSIGDIVLTMAQISLYGWNIG